MVYETIGDNMGISSASQAVNNSVIQSIIFESMKREFSLEGLRQALVNNQVGGIFCVGNEKKLTSGNVDFQFFSNGIKGDLTYRKLVGCNEIYMRSFEIKNDSFIVETSEDFTKGLVGAISEFCLEHNIARFRTKKDIVQNYFSHTGKFANDCNPDSSGSTMCITYHKKEI